MNKKLIVLSGVSNSGKSNTLKMVIDELIDDLKVHYSMIKVYNQSKKLSDNKLNFVQIKGDVIVILLNVIDGINIGINTAGDTSEHVDKSLSLLQNCDIVICATKVYDKYNDGSVNEIQKFILDNHNNIDLVPFYKILRGENSSDTNDLIIKEIIVKQVKLYLNIKNNI